LDPAAEYRQLLRFQVREPLLATVNIGETPFSSRQGNHDP
jgi:hypothetical protein